MRGSLFRQQALDHQRPTLIGNTLAAQPISFRVITALAVALAAIVVLFGCFGEYTQKARVSGYLAPNAALIKVYAPAAGTLVEKHVMEGQHVRRGDTLFVLSTDRASSTAPVEQQELEPESPHLLIITAPSDGTVAAVMGDRGLSAKPQSPLLSILPRDAQLQARLLVPSRAIGSVHVGDAVRVRYQAFPYQRYGSFTGAITEISRTLIAPAELDGTVTVSEPAYRVTVALDSQTIAVGDTKLPLQPGMQLEADVPLLRRRLIQWVFEPLLAVAGKA